MTSKRGESLDPHQSAKVDRRVILLPDLPTYLEDFFQGHELPIPKSNNLSTTGLELEFDETQQMLQIHASTVMNVRIDFTDVVEISMGD